MAHSEQEFYSYVERALDSEQKVKQLEQQLKQQQNQPTAPVSPVPTISKADLNDVQKLRSRFGDQDVTKMLISGGLKVVHE